MKQKLLIGGLAIAILAVIGFGLYDAAQVADVETETAIVPATAAALTNTPAPTPVVVVESEVTAAVEVVTDVAQPQVLAQSSMGEAWLAEGVITLLDDFGFMLATTDGDFYVELGPPDYWQAQGVMLAEGDTVNVDGYYNGVQVHARVVTANGAQLVIRTQDGQPMWAGGAENGNNGQAAGTGSQTQTQVTAEDWLTLTGTIGSVSNGNVTLNVNDGSVITLQMGQPQFWQSQGISLNVGDPVEVLGFWQGEQFMAGDIRKIATGETIMLRDPNGRQLWAGPGRNGNGGSGSNGNNGNGGNGGSNGNGNGNSGNGNGNNAASTATGG